MEKIDKSKDLYESLSSDYDIEIVNLFKEYQLKKKKQKIIALKGINLKVKKGEIFGLLGPNGAGKTTLVSILTTLIQPTDGYATILGHNILEEAWFVRENVGLMLGAEMLYYRITGYKNLKFFSKLYGIKNYKNKIADLAEKFNLSKWMDQYVSNYSKGMKLKLALARILLIEPKILFLDEPMLGLDPPSVKQVIEYLQGLNKTIFLTSHQMDVVQKMCDRIAFLKEGEILKVDTKENFKKLIMEKIKIKVKVSKNKIELIKTLKNLDFVSEIKEHNNDILFLIKNESFFQDIFNILKDYTIIRFNESRPGLDDVFIQLSR